MEAPSCRVGFDIHWKKGMVNTQSDTLFRLLSGAHATALQDIEVPCYTFECANSANNELSPFEDDGEEGFSPLDAKQETWMDSLALMEKD